MQAYRMRYIGWLTWCRGPGFFWMRWKHRRGMAIQWDDAAPLFSERNGYRKVIRFGRFRIEALK